MRKPRILFDFLRNNDPKLEIQCNAILSCMGNNQYFPNPTPSLGEMTTAWGNTLRHFLLRKIATVYTCNRKLKTGKNWSWN